MYFSVCSNIITVIFYFKLNLFFFQLSMRENDLIEVPKELGQLARLRELHLQGNRLVVLPPEIGEYSKNPFKILQILMKSFSTEMET